MTYTTEYGTTETGQIVLFGDRNSSYLRDDVYTSNADGLRYHNRVFCLNANDHTEPHDKMNHYNPNCPCCWLNIPHTSALHLSHLQ